ncbi:MAG: cell division protein SepF [Candidatus Heimdallarchaeaceae archaeon]
MYSLVDVARAERIVTEVEEGNLVFLNIGRITAFPERKKEFLQNLKDCSAQLHVTLKMISEETIMVAPSSVPIEIRSLSPVKIEEESEDTLDELENN